MEKTLAQPVNLIGWASLYDQDRSWSFPKVRFVLIDIIPPGKFTAVYIYILIQPYLTAYCLMPS